MATGLSLVTQDGSSALCVRRMLMSLYIHLIPARKTRLYYSNPRFGRGCRGASNLSRDGHRKRHFWGGKEDVYCTEDQMSI